MMWRYRFADAINDKMYDGIASGDNTRKMHSPLNTSICIELVNKLNCYLLCGCFGLII